MGGYWREGIGNNWMGLERCGGHRYLVVFAGMGEKDVVDWVKVAAYSVHRKASCVAGVKRYGNFAGSGAA